MIGIPRRIVFQEILDAHVRTNATRELEGVISSRETGGLDASNLEPGAEVYVFYKRSKKNEEIICVEETGFEVGEHIVK